MRRFVMLVAATSLFVGCSGVSQEEFAAKELEASKYKKDFEDQSGKAAAAEQKVTALQSQVTALQKQLADANARVQSTSATAAAAQTETAEMKARQAAVLGLQVMFKENSTALSPEAKKALDSAAEALMQLSDKAVIVSAYTDDTEGGKGAAGDAKRWQLSTNRAIEVAKYLAGRGVKPEIVGIAGFGQARPVAPNDSIANRGQNRRAEIMLTPADFQLKTIDVKPATIQK